MGSWNDRGWCWQFHVDADSLLEDPVATEEAFSLIELLTNISPTLNAQDTLSWWPNQDGQFSVKSFYNLMHDRDSEDVLDTQSKLAFKRIWKTSIPSRLKVFGWRVVLNRIPTKDQLAKRGVIRDGQQQLCTFCQDKVEDLEQLMFNCSISQRVWSSICGWLDIKGMGDSVGVNHLRNFTQALTGKIKKKKLYLIWLTTVWSLWMARNNFLFRDEPWVFDDLVMNIKELAWSWHTIGNRGSCCTSLYNWLYSPLDFLKSD
ncbi:uncharacterized protein LOC131635664 [Vicia villosa]|uniref:uncharacterized protein LOC131635664 n=1 Tax=Vicia villosa TaxID=3911 RepID=UPI00273B9000|nr:uncharacterized protein LOC131635664 [Vicia villosa]